MNKQTFEITNGVYVGPAVWEGDLNLRDYKDTLISLGPLTKVDGDLWLRDCTNLVSLGSLMEVRKWLDLRGCTNLVSLGSLKEVGGSLDLEGCTSLTSLGSLTEVGDFLWLTGCTSLASLGSLNEVGNWLDLEGCTSLSSLGSVKKLGGGLFFGDEKTPLQEGQEKIRYYSSLPLHEALNALLTDEVQGVPLYKNILLQTLQGG